MACRHRKVSMVRHTLALAACHAHDLCTTGKVKKTCFKPLGQFLLAPKLKRIVAFNKGGELWEKLAGFDAVAEGKQAPGCLCITFELRTRVMYIGANAQDQIQLRHDYLQQCSLLFIMPEALQGDARETPSKICKKSSSKPKRIRRSRGAKK